MEIVKKLALGFSNIRLQKGDIDDAYLSTIAEGDQQRLYELLGGKRTTDVMTVHKKYNSKNEPVSDTFFDLRINESAGTNKFFDLLAPL